MVRIGDDLISVIVPVYNMEPYLERCIQSILTQSYFQLDIILVDDGSTDNSLKLMEQYAARDKRIRVYHQENGGVSAARNYGLRKMNGKYCTFIDPDDYVPPCYIEWLLYAIKQTDTKLAICNGRSFANGSLENFPVLPKLPTVDLIRLEGFSLWHKASHAVCWGALYDKTIIDDMLFDITLFNAEDMLFFIQALLKCDAIAFINEQIYYYVQYANSATKGAYNPKRWTEITALQKLIDLVKDSPALLRQSVQAWYAMTCAKLYTLILNSRYCDNSKLHYLLQELRNNKAAVLSIPMHKSSKKIRLLAFMVFPRVVSAIQWRYYVKKGIAF